MDIDKIQFGELSQSKGIDKSFEDLDINSDGKINEEDKNSATDSEIKDVISELLSSDTDEENKCDNDEINYEEIYKELSEIQNKKDYDINGDGKVSYGDINALYSLIQYDPNEIFSDSLKVTKTRKDGLQYKSFENAYTQKAKSAFQSVIRGISLKVSKDTSEKFNVCKSESNREELQISDFIQLYNDLKNLPEDSLKLAGLCNGNNSSLDTTLLYYKNTFNLTTAYAQVSESEKEQLQQIVQELSSDSSNLSDILHKSTLKNLKTTATSISENAIIYTNAVNEISSQLVNGDIPEGKSITFSLSDTNQITITNKNGTYIYHLVRQYTSYDGKIYYEDEYLTDKQIDSVLSCATDLVSANSTVKNLTTNGMWMGDGTGLSSKVKEILGATLVSCGKSYKITNEKYVSEYTFTNEFGQTSTTYLRDCDGCAGSPSNAIGDFLFANKIRGLLDLAKANAGTTQSTATTGSTQTTAATSTDSTSEEEAPNNESSSINESQEKTSASKTKLADYSLILEEMNEKHLEKLKEEYEELTEKIKDTEDETEKANLETQAQKLKSEIAMFSV